MARGLRSNRDGLETRQIRAPVTGPAPDTEGPSSGDATLARLQGADDLKAIEALAGTSGLLAKTAANTWALRTLQPDAGSIVSWTAGDGAAGNPTPVFAPQNANEVFCAPASGSPGVPGFRALVVDDLGSADTFVPVVSFTTPGDSSFVYARQDGEYQRIGDVVYFELDLEFTPNAYASASGNLRFSLPFTAKNSINRGVALDIFGAVTWPAGTTMANATCILGLALGEIVSFGSGASRAGWGTTQFPASTSRRFRVSGTYLAA